MSNQTITITRKEKYALEQKAKSGWRCFFIQREANYHLQETTYRMAGEVNRLRREATNPSNAEYEHLKSMFLELYDKVGELTNCPICFDPMTKDTTHVGSCGHLVCKTCKTRISQCPICRKSY